MIFFFGFIMLFSIIFRVIGVEIYKDDYAEFSLTFAYFVYAYRNAIGDVQTPSYAFWLTKAQNKNEQISAWAMIGLIWIFWFGN